MVRLLANLGRLDLGQVSATGEHARRGLDALARDYSGLMGGVRGAGVMLGFDIARADWRDAVRDRAFRRGLILLPAGERTLRFYPRYDTPAAAIHEALSILRAALDDGLGGRVEAGTALGREIRVGTLECALEAVETIELTAATFATLGPEVMAVEIDRYGGGAQYPPDVLRAGRRPLLQFP